MLNIVIGDVNVLLNSYLCRPEMGGLATKSFSAFTVHSEVCITSSGSYALHLIQRSVVAEKGRKEFLTLSFKV